MKVAFWQQIGYNGTTGFLLQLDNAVRGWIFTVLWHYGYAGIMNGENRKGEKGCFYLFRSIIITGNDKSMKLFMGLLVFGRVCRTVNAHEMQKNK